MRPRSTPALSLGVVILASLAPPAVLASVTTEERVEKSRCVAPISSPPPPRARKASTCPRDPKGERPLLRKGKVSFPGAKGTPKVEVEIARSSSEHERGLMYRTSLGGDRGMIFSWRDERIRAFWMKNTCIPLDMLFLASDGTVVGVLEQVPVLNETLRSVHCAASHVLEVNAGWSREHGVTPGMKATLDL